MLNSQRFPFIESRGVFRDIDAVPILPLTLSYKNSVVNVSVLLDLLHECKTCPHPPTPSPKIGRRGVNFKVPLPSLGEGFRVRVRIHARSLLDTGASINVLPYSLGIQLGVS